MADRQEHVDGGDGSRPRIVVGVDGSEDSGRALDWAAKEAVGRGAVLDIRTFYEPGYTHITAEEVARTMERTVEEAAARAAAVAPGVVTTTAVREASPPRPCSRRRRVPTSWWSARGTSERSADSCWAPSVTRWCCTPPARWPSSTDPVRRPPDGTRSRSAHRAGVRLLSDMVPDWV